MTKISDFFNRMNIVENVDDHKYQNLQLLIKSLEAASRSIYHSTYVIDYAKQRFFYVSNNPLFLCGLSAEEVKALGYQFYLDYVPKEDLQMLLEINQAGFDFFTNKTLPEERIKCTLSYDFHLLNNGKKMLINHKLTPIVLTSEGKIWLALCTVSLSSRKSAGNVFLRKANDPEFWKYSRETQIWKKEAAIVLTNREKEIIRLSTQGFSVKEIADASNISINTVKDNKKRLFEKLDVNCIQEAILLASNHRLM